MSGLKIKDLAIKTFQGIAKSSYKASKTFPTGLKLGDQIGNNSGKMSQVPKQTQFFKLGVSAKMFEHKTHFSDQTKISESAKFGTIGGNISSGNHEYQVEGDVRLTLAEVSMKGGSMPKGKLGQVQGKVTAKKQGLTDDSYSFHGSIGGKTSVTGLTPMVPSLSMGYGDARTGDGYTLTFKQKDDSWIPDRSLTKNNEAPEFKEEKKKAQEFLQENRVKNEEANGLVFNEHVRLPGGDHGFDPEVLVDLIDKDTNRDPAKTKARETRNETTGTQFQKDLSDEQIFGK